MNDREASIANQIAKRTVALSAKYGNPWKVFDARLDIEACHKNCPLRLDDLLAADDFNFGHDVFGINRHLNRDTCELENHFRPRFAVPEPYPEDGPLAHLNAT